MSVNDRRYRLLFAASEAVGFAKTGGLGDVAGALPRALTNRGHDCRVVLPLYRSARLAGIPLTNTGLRCEVPMGHRTVCGVIYKSSFPGCSTPVYLIEQPEYFERDDPSQGRGLYHFTLSDGRMRDYPDNCERFVFFGRAVLEMLRLLDFWPEVLHANDWQTGLLPVYLRQIYGRQRPYSAIRTLFTIHNMAYQGQFWHWDMLLTGLDWSLFNPQQLEFHGQLNFLKAGIVFADWISTVSPTYAKEIQTPYFGCGLHGVLYERRERLRGIVNGVDYRSWNPATDQYLTEQYTAETVHEGKRACKAALQRHFGLPQLPQIPLLGMVARLVEQKGIDLVLRAADDLLRHGAQLIVLGQGDTVYHRRLTELRSRHPDCVGLHLGFDEQLARQIEAGSDIFLMPSQYEPAGLNQLYSLRYGTVPVVRATGGLADTITPCTADTLATGTATGFSFQAFTPAALSEAVLHAMKLYGDSPQDWRKLVQTGMRKDWSWERIVLDYEALYADVLEKN